MKKLKGDRSKSLNRGRDVTLTLMILPPAIMIFLFSYVPLPGLIVAFKKFKVTKGLFGSDWAGLKNFKFFFKSSDAAKVLRNTLGMNITFIILTLVVSVTVALMLNEIRSRVAVKTIQTIMFFPYFISWVVASYMVYAFCNQQYGIMNSVCDFLKIPRIPWYSESKYWPFILSFLYIWKNAGYQSVIYYASIMGIDDSYYEAAALDGASRWQMVWRITIPNLKTVIICMTVLALGKVMYSDFGLFYQVPRDIGSLYATTDVLDTYIYRALCVTGNISVSAAVGFIQAIVGFTLIMVTNGIVRKIDRESAIF